MEELISKIEFNEKLTKLIDGFDFDTAIKMINILGYKLSKIQCKKIIERLGVKSYTAMRKNSEIAITSQEGIFRLDFFRGKTKCSEKNFMRISFCPIYEDDEF